MNKRITLLWVCCCLTFTMTSAAEEDRTSRIFTETHPLVYEDAWDLWPYVFLNENGEPVGYNIDLLKLIFKELDIPYVIKLKPTTSALKDLQSGTADLMCGMDAHFNAEYGKYSKTVIQIFTHSVVHRKGDKPLIKTVNDLAHHRVIVHGGSFSHHLMMRRGWGGNAIPINDMHEAVQMAHNEGTQIVWNTMSLAYLIRKLRYDDLQLTPVRVQHGEYKFMSNNPHLLHQIDSVYTILNASGRLQAIQNKWFYPDHRDSGIPSWIWYVIAAALLALLLLSAFVMLYHRRERLLTRDIRRRNNRLSLILSTSGVHIWIYNVPKKTISRYDDSGNVVEENIQPKDFFAHLRHEDGVRVHNALRELSLQEQDAQTLDVASPADGDGVKKSYLVTLSVLRRDKFGKPLDIIGTSCDVTDEQRRRQQVEDSLLRYQAVFNSTMVDIVAYDDQAVIVDMNDWARNKIPVSLDYIQKSHVHVSDVLGMPEVTADNMEPMYMTQLLRRNGDERTLARYIHTDRLYYEIMFNPLRDADGSLQAIYATGRNVTDLAQSYRQQKQNSDRLQHANEVLSTYIRNIDYVMQNGGVRLIDYSPDTHTVTVHGQVGSRRADLTQMRCVSLMADESKRTAQRVFNSMDSRTPSVVSGTVKTVLRHPHKSGEPALPLCLYLSLVPVMGADGSVTSYFGMCRDVSELKNDEARLAVEATRAREVEAVKNAFLRNMSYQIRIPLNSVVGFAELFEQEHAGDDEPFFIQQINDNASLLLKLINDILFLSRLDARMIELKREPSDMADFFTSRCQTAWFHYQQPGVSYVVDNPYEHLVVDIDTQNLGVVIDKIVGNAAQYTTAGEVRAGYVYTGEALLITIQDTGCGIDAELLAHVFDRFATSDGQKAGLGLSISHELVSQMGGKVKIQSTTGHGTIVWITIPCQCSEIVRKKVKEGQAV